MIRQALLLVTNQAELIKGLLTAVHSCCVVSCCPFLHSPVPLVDFINNCGLSLFTPFWDLLSKIHASLLNFCYSHFLFFICLWPLVLSV